MMSPLLAVQVPSKGFFSLAGPAVDRALVTPQDVARAAANTTGAGNSTSGLGTPLGSSNGTISRAELLDLVADMQGSFDERANASLAALLESRGAGGDAGGGAATNSSNPFRTDTGGLSIPQDADLQALMAQQLQQSSGGADGGSSGAGGTALGGPAVLGLDGPAQAAGQQQAVPLPVRQGTGSSLDAAVPRAAPGGGQSAGTAGPAAGLPGTRAGGAAGEQQQSKGPLLDLLDLLSRSPLAKLFEREAKKLPSARLAQGTAGTLRNLTSTATARLVNSSAEVQKQAYSLAGQLAYNASDLGIRSGVRLVDAADSLVEVGYNSSQGVRQAALNATNSLVDAAVGDMVQEVGLQGGDLRQAVAARQAEMAGGLGDGAAGGVQAAGLGDEFGAGDAAAGDGGDDGAGLQQEGAGGMPMLQG